MTKYTNVNVGTKSGGNPAGTTRWELETLMSHEDIQRAVDCGCTIYDSEEEAILGQFHVVATYDNQWFYGYALDSSDELSNPAGPYANEEEALAAAGFPGRWAEYPPHLVCGVARRHNDGSLRVGSRLLRGW